MGDNAPANADITYIQKNIRWLNVDDFKSAAREGQFDTVISSMSPGGDVTSTRIPFRKG